ncbi:hypothetical protein PQX77_006331 [Marasmius sp. AFHP31]|nr:hypothetical protein PQX77_006331 [Marasmius sp. AFHP31]
MPISLPAPRDGARYNIPLPPSPQVPPTTADLGRAIAFELDLHHQYQDEGDVTEESLHNARHYWQELHSSSFPVPVPIPPAQDNHQELINLINAVHGDLDVIRKDIVGLKEEVATLKEDNRHSKKNLATMSRAAVKYLNKKTPRGAALEEAPLRDDTMPWGATRQLKTTCGAVRNRQAIVTMAEAPGQFTFTDVLLPSLNNLAAINNLSPLELAAYYEAYCEDEGGAHLTKEVMTAAIRKAIGRRSR